MKKILFACAVCLLLAGTAHAASLSIGGESISYTVPQGYLPGDKEPYLLSLIHISEPTRPY